MTLVIPEPEPVTTTPKRLTKREATDLLAGVDEAAAVINGAPAAAEAYIAGTFACYQGQAWLGLGYADWPALCAARPQMRLNRETRPFIVVALANLGMSQHAISKATGADRKTIRSDIAATGGNSPSRTLSQDGREIDTTAIGRTPPEPESEPEAPEPAKLPDRWYIVGLNGDGDAVATPTGVEGEPTLALLDAEMVEKLGVTAGTLTWVEATTDVEARERLDALNGELPGEPLPRRRKRGRTPRSAGPKPAEKATAKPATAKPAALGVTITKYKDHPGPNGITTEAYEVAVTARSSLADQTWATKKIGAALGLVAVVKPETKEDAHELLRALKTVSDHFTPNTEGSTE